MRPSVTEQLNGLRRILEEVIAPELLDPYPADILAGVCATLETLAAGWSEVSAFLRWDTAASTGVLTAMLAAAGPDLDAQLVSEVRAAIEGAAPDATDVLAIEAHHHQVRAALERAVPVITEREDLSELRTHLVVVLRQRAERYPLKTVWRPSAPAPPR